MQETLALQPEATTTTQSSPEEHKFKSDKVSNTIAASALVNLKIQL